MTLVDRDIRLASGVRLTGTEPARARHRPVLLIPGLFAPASVLAPWQHFLAERGWPAWTLDLRGRAGSRAVGDVGRVRLAEYAEDAVEAAAHLGQPMLVGHSMGGLLAQHAAAAGHAQGLVLLASAPPAGISVLSGRLLAAMVPYLGALLGSRPFTGSLAAHERLTMHRVPPAERAALHARLVPDSGRAARDLALSGLRVDADAVRCPVVSVVAEDDRFVPPRVGEKIAARYHCALWRYPEHGHFLVLEPGWERVAADVERWLAHVESLPEHAAAYEKMWAQLQRLIGEEVTLRFHDGRVVEVEVVNVDLARHRDVIYEVRRVVEPGPGAMRQPEEGDTARSAVHELVGVGRAMAEARG